MTDLGASGFGAARRRVVHHVDWVWAATPLGLLLVAMLAPEATAPMAAETAGSFLHTLPFIVFAISAAAYLRAAGAAGVAAKAFTGHPARMVVLAALAGGLAPFCSCEVIPFIAALLAVGAPLGAVMAFWLASPLMDPAQFAITSGALGVEFAAAKLIAAVTLGMAGGFIVTGLARSPIFADPLRPGGIASRTGCCGAKSPFDEAPVWAVWREGERIAAFRRTFFENSLFLAKWLLLAYFLEAAMVRWIPAETIGATLGGDGIGTIILAAILGAPAYLNGYAAAPLAAGLIEQGVNPGAAMSFMLAGGVTCVPAAVAVFSLVRLRVFAAYIGFAFIGSVAAGLAFAAWT